MKNTCGFIAIMGILSEIIGTASYSATLVTLICGILYLYYPSENIDRYNEDKECKYNEDKE